ncbi:MAG TPA: aminotransferase class III-fold pyridoxal phosphate-dependent enzyme, partial [Vicinamibacteria bacterium]|nr:aminotransferase class III-fold pyridoxal phosphate-dependent enzyme [Vicinamibacteria bacterium]
YFPRIREICTKYEVLLVSDEVITGFGRTGTKFGLEHWGVEPDMIQFAKGITSGYFPLGGIGLSDEIAKTIDGADPVWMHAYTYSSHPVGCRVALANMDIVEREGLVGEAKRKGKKLLDGLRTLASHSHVGDVRGLGMMCAVEIVKDKATKEEFPAGDKVGFRVHEETQKRGLYSRHRGDVFLLAPPLVTSDAEIDRCVQILGESIGAVLGR